MRRVSIPRTVAAGAVTSAAALAVAVGSSVPATADPSSVTTTEFQVPVRYVAGCGSNIFPCYSLPPLTTVTPTATTGAPGEMIFATRPATQTWSGTSSCPDVSVHWLNLTTGAAGTVLLRPVPPDRGRAYTPEDWCRYTPAAAVTGSGTVAASADIGAPAPSEYQILHTPGVGIVPVL
ncbi:hypothetical protein [Rhodococcus sp. NPDC127528]|uniref:hypothetical protein n=1 Tax=unclassified Rhodococcus (in: high G+C Gram-positive bacteria) TaxID=192944 RepID=UPI00364330CB